MKTTSLAALLFVEMGGFRELLSRDDSVALRLLERYRSLVDPLIAEHGGETVDATGDELLVVFSSAVAAVQCALHLRLASRTLGERGSEAPKLRIGIHLGEIWRDESKVYGNGVNLAARVMQEAQPGSILVSEDLFRQVNNKLDLGARELPGRALKNIERPLVLYEIFPEGPPPEPLPDQIAATTASASAAPTPASPSPAATPPSMPPLPPLPPLKDDADAVPAPEAGGSMAASGAALKKLVLSHVEDELASRRITLKQTGAGDLDITIDKGDGAPFELHIDPADKLGKRDLLERLEEEDEEDEEDEDEDESHEASVPALPPGSAKAVLARALGKNHAAREEAAVKAVSDAARSLGFAAVVTGGFLWAYLSYKSLWLAGAGLLFGFLPLVSKVKKLIKGSFELRDARRDRKRAEGPEKKR